MVIKNSDIPGILVKRIEASYPAPALFSTTETDDWPSGAMGYLLDTHVLQRANRADTIVCPGCEWQCHKAVVVRAVNQSSKLRAFINCDEEPARGRVPVPNRNLIQHSTTLATMAGVVARHMKLGILKPTVTGRSYRLGSVKGRNGHRTLQIGMDDEQLFLVVGKQGEHLVNLLRWTGSELKIDMAQIQRLANRKQTARPSAKADQPDRIKQRQQTRKTQTRNNSIFREAKRLRAAGARNWTAIAASIAASDFVLDKHGRRPTPATVRRIITDKLKIERQNSRSVRK